MTSVTVSSPASNGLRTEIKAGAHKLVSDATKDVGGSESGPDPHELLLAALGSCTSMTLKLFAGKRGWELKDVKVNLTEEPIDDPGNPGKKISRISRHIEVEGNLTQEQLDSLKSIADKCPIHKLLTGSKEVTTDLSKA